MKKRRTYIVGILITVFLLAGIGNMYYTGNRFNKIRRTGNGRFLQSRAQCRYIPL